MEKKKKSYPFAAIVGQGKMKKALILNIINPKLGGVLIRGEKGTAKSTAVRALAELLPQRLQVEGCPFSCDPEDGSQLCCRCAEEKRRGRPLKAVESPMRVVDLPVSATEDRVVGTLDIEHAITKGEKKFEPGILAQANRNILYVDEVNLLDDHVVDVMLDSAAMGINTVEREGISYSHPARFILVGTMNPEEGDLRPQLLDRFGMVVDVMGEQDPGLRVDVIRRRLGYEADPERFCLGYATDHDRLVEEIAAAKALLEQVVCEDNILILAARIAITLDVDGHRADIGMIKTAMTLAAWHGRTTVDSEDLLEAAELVLPHRMRRRPFEEGVVDLDRVRALIMEQ